MKNACLLPCRHRNHAGQRRSGRRRNGQRKTALILCDEARFTSLFSTGGISLFFCAPPPHLALAEATSSAASCTFSVCCPFRYFSRPSPFALFFFIAWLNARPLFTLIFVFPVPQPLPHFTALCCTRSRPVALSGRATNLAFILTFQRHFKFLKQYFDLRKMLWTLSVGHP